MSENIARVPAISEKEYHGHFESMLVMLEGLLDCKSLKYRIKKSYALPENLKNSVDIALSRHIKENIPLFADVFSQYVMIAEESGHDVDVELKVVLSEGSFDIRECMIYTNREAKDFIVELADIWIGHIVSSRGGESHKAIYSFYKDEEKKYGKFVDKLIERCSIEVLKEIVPHKRYVITIRLPALSFIEIEVHKWIKQEGNLNFFPDLKP